MKALTKGEKLFGVVVILILLTAPFWLQPPPETKEFTFQRPVGGEERRVETVKLYCTLTDQWWCQEVILEEEPHDFIRQ